MLNRGMKRFRAAYKRLKRAVKGSKKAVDTCAPEVPSSPSPTAPTAPCSIEASSLSTTDSPHPDQCHEPTLAAMVPGCAAGEAGPAAAAGQLLDCGPEPLERVAGVPKISQPSAVNRCAGAVSVSKGSAAGAHLRHTMDVQALLKQCVSPAHGFFGEVPVVLLADLQAALEQHSQAAMVTQVAASDAAAPSLQPPATGSCASQPAPLIPSHPSSRVASHSSRMSVSVLEAGLAGPGAGS
ncbi:hypothetical protein HaLaN_30457, partial [Haematococcus lacustris]